ncbi:hypothetical protein MSAN_02059300 [Mycena sanguinolenta]|uniref:Uncharacterized protein n=1 Tax=Mycena sanguinolenta TaxID=230812 RepID=A0A8H7CL05_9AGAR|nr:hypothetical protein MSAN_02059300 [Mycena sanguinolenta]
MVLQPGLASPSPRFRSIPCKGVDLDSGQRVITIGLVISARLESTRLEATLWPLVEHKFPRAGARLAFRNEVYELQIPEQFDSETPPFVFTVQEYYLTFLGFLAPHAAFDAVGAGTLLAAWTRLLRGEHLHNIPGMEWDTKPFAPLECGPVNLEVPRGWFKGSRALGPQKKREASPAESDPKDVRRFVRIPKAFLEDAKKKIMDELKARGSTEYVGSSDVLRAWWLKSVYGHRSLTDHTPVHVHVLINLRGLPVFANDAPLKGPYIHSTISTIPIPPIPASAFQAESLGALALCIRRSILAYTADPEAIRADLRWRRAEANRLEILCPCPPDAEYLFLTDYRAAKFDQLDFTGAVEGSEGMKTATRVVFVYPLLCTVLKPYRRGVNRVLMDDADAVWMSETREEKDWEDIRQTSGVTFTDSPPV